MKPTKNILSFLLVAVLALSAGCKKDPVMYAKGFETFKLTLKNAVGTVAEYPGTITGEEIVVALPTETDVTALKASFTMDNPRTIVQVGKVVQESGVSEQDFTLPVPYTVKAEDRSTRTYSVRVEKKVAFKSFGFFKEDNPALTTDYKGVIKGLKINISLPESVDLTKLVARFETSAGVTLKVAGVAQVSKTTINDFSVPVVYSFTEASLPAALDFTVNISFLGPQWFIIGNEDIIVPTASGIKIAFDPFTNFPYIVYQRTGKDENGVSIETDNRKLAMVRYTGTAWEPVGDSKGITDFRADNANIAFDKDGTLYLGYLDYTNSENKPSVVKYSNFTWTTVGTKRFTPMKADKISFNLGENDQPVVALSSNSTDVPAYPRRTLYVTGYKGTQWSDITPVSNFMVTFSQVIKGLDGKTYLAILDRTSKANMYKLVNNAWVPVGPTAFSTSDGLPGYTSINGAVDANGVPYIAYQTVVSSQRNNRVLKFNGTSWIELGNAGSSEGETDKYNLAIHPDGTVFFVYVNNSGLYFRTFNTTKNNWNTPRLIISGKINGFDMKINAEGTPYLAASLNSTNKTVVYKYTLPK